MKFLNKLLKTVLYILTMSWTFLSIYLFALICSSAVAGLVLSFLSLIKVEIMYVICPKLWWIVLLLAVPIAVWIIIVVLWRAHKTKKEVQDRINKASE